MVCKEHEKKEENLLCKDIHWGGESIKMEERPWVAIQRSQIMTDLYHIRATIFIGKREERKKMGFSGTLIPDEVSPRFRYIHLARVGI